MAETLNELRDQYEVFLKREVRIRPKPMNTDTDGQHLYSLTLPFSPMHRDTTWETASKPPLTTLPTKTPDGDVQECKSPWQSSEPKATDTSVTA